jgi:hypothetical protein
VTLTLYWSIRNGLLLETTHVVAESYLIVILEIKLTPEQWNLPQIGQYQITRDAGGREQYASQIYVKFISDF